MHLRRKFFCQRQRLVLIVQRVRHRRTVGFIDMCDPTPSE
jgi:hypothetical protein